MSHKEKGKLCSIDATGLDGVLLNKEKKGHQPHQQPFCKAVGARTILQLHNNKIEGTPILKLAMVKR